MGTGVLYQNTGGGDGWSSTFGKTGSGMRIAFKGWKANFMGRGKIYSEGRKLVKGGYEGGMWRYMGGEGGGRIAFEGKRCNWGETGETAAPEADFSALHQKVFHSTHCTAQHTHLSSALGGRGKFRYIFWCSWALSGYHELNWEGVAFVARDDSPNAGHHTTPLDT